MSEYITKRINERTSEIIVGKTITRSVLKKDKR